MEALGHSVSALSVHSTSLSRGPKSQDVVQQLPFSHVAPGSRSSSPFARAHCSIFKPEAPIASRSSSTHDGVWFPQARVRVHQQRPIAVVLDSAAGGYAAALLEIGQTNNILDIINRDIEKLSHFLKNQEIYDFLINSIVDNKKKKSILKAIADDAKFHTYTLKFLNLLVDKKSVGIIKNILKEFEKIYNEVTDTQVAIVSSALKLEKYQLSQIAKNIQRLTGAKNVKLQNVIDPSVIEGFTIRLVKNASHIVKGQYEKLSAMFYSAQEATAF